MRAGLLEGLVPVLCTPELACRGSPWNSPPPGLPLARAPKEGGSAAETQGLLTLLPDPNEEVVLGALGLLQGGPEGEEQSLEH